MTHPNRPAFVEAMFDDEDWRKHVAGVGLVGAKTELCQLKGELRIQRRRHAGTPDYFDFIRKQAGFENVVAQRLREIEASLQANPDASGRKYRERISSLVNLVGVLALAIDETDLDPILDDHEIELHGERMTLAEAIDAGRFDRPEIEAKAVAS